jgi:hypothetical protein
MIDIVEISSTKRPAVKTADGSTGAAVGGGSGCVGLMCDNLEEAFGNYPNPFGTAEHPTTTITYYLKENTNIQFSIFTLLGELVHTENYKETDPQGQAGSHDGDIIWDGTNDMGKKVLNGVYVGYIKTGYGETAITKIAIVK